MATCIEWNLSYAGDEAADAAVAGTGSSPLDDGRVSELVIDRIRDSG
jgi:hypothetical protein